MGYKLSANKLLKRDNQPLALLTVACPLAKRYVQKDEMNIKLKDFPLYILGFFVLGLLLGGIYSLPAMLVTKDKEPWLTILLALGLSISVATVGTLFFQSNTHIIYAVISANILLFIRRAFGKLDHNVERFGMVHVVSLMGCSCLALLT